jgi:Type I 3-dehydroquinase/Shikimate dehydrogenase substrate binding domain
VPIIGLVMKDRGVISRMIYPKFGGYLTFGALSKGRESAPGQITGSELLNVYRIKEIGPDTKVFGIIGKPVGHSKSPNLHNEAFRSVGFNAVYVPYLVDDLPSFLSTYSSPDFAGFRYAILTYYIILFLFIVSMFLGRADAETQMQTISMRCVALNITFDPLFGVQFWVIWFIFFSKKWIIVLWHFLHTWVIFLLPFGISALFTFLM